MAAIFNKDFNDILAKALETQDKQEQISQIKNAFDVISDFLIDLLKRVEALENGKN